MAPSWPVGPHPPREGQVLLPPSDLPPAQSGQGSRGTTAHTRRTSGSPRSHFVGKHHQALESRGPCHPPVGVPRPWVREWAPPLGTHCNGLEPLLLRRGLCRQDPGGGDAPGQGGRWRRPPHGASRVSSWRVGSCPALSAQPCDLVGSPNKPPLSSRTGPQGREGREGGADADTAQGTPGCLPPSTHSSSSPWGDTRGHPPASPCSPRVCSVHHPPWDASASPGSPGSPKAQRGRGTSLVHGICSKPLKGQSFLGAGRRPRMGVRPSGPCPTLCSPEPPPPCTAGSKPQPFPPRCVPVPGSCTACAQEASAAARQEDMVLLPGAWTGTRPAGVLARGSLRKS